MLDNFPEISKLPLEKKIILVEEIWDSIRSERIGNEIPESHKKFLNDRLNTLDYNKLLSLEQLIDRVRQKNEI